MANQYIDIPLFTTFNGISGNNYSLSASQYKSFIVKNKNLISVRDFLTRDLHREDLGNEVGSNAYVEYSEYSFIKTRALQPESYLLDINKESVQHIVPSSFVDSQLKEGDLLISKDSNVGEIVILDRDYPNTMLCGGLYKLPEARHPYYLLAFVKHDIFRHQIDFMVPKGSTIRHGKTKFLECMIPMPNQRTEQTIRYVELLTQAIVNKEMEIRRKYHRIQEEIFAELTENQNAAAYQYSLPSIREIKSLDRLDSSLYSDVFRKNEHLITNYKNGYQTLSQLGFSPSRGQNLQVSNIGHSIYSDYYQPGFYKLIRPTNISVYGTISKFEYLGNSNQLLCLREGDLIFGAEGTFRSFVNIKKAEKTITNIHGVTLTQTSHDLTKGIFVKLILDYCREREMLSAYAVGGNGGSLAIKYLSYLKFPNFPAALEQSLVKLYHNADVQYHTEGCDLDHFREYDARFNDAAGIYELDQSMKYLQQKLDDAISCIANDDPVAMTF